MPVLLPEGHVNESIDFGRPFQFVFEDKDWLKKVLMGAVMMIGSILILPYFILVGYQRRVALASAGGKDVPLPEWDRFGEDLGHGFKMFLIGFVWILPGVAVRLVGLIPVILAAVAENHGHGGDAMSAATGGIFFLTTCLGSLLTIAGMIAGILGVLRYIDVGELGAGFQPGELFRLLKDNVVNLLLTAVILILAGLAAEIVGFIACGVGLLVTMPWALMVAGQVYGQVIRIDRAKRGVAPGSPALQPTR